MTQIIKHNLQLKETKHSSEPNKFLNQAAEFLQRGSLFQALGA